ncbi:MAG TPA: hypothetical protein VGS22_24080 [Thermoanaerobaculia bacterium]|jgi:hypothetical protein|nr:hypothetical protein [Thermoanaerobaculia bacterium]
MKKRVKKLHLSKESVSRLDLGPVVGGITLAQTDCLACHNTIDRTACITNCPTCGNTNYETCFSLCPC